MISRIGVLPQVLVCSRTNLAPASRPVLPQINGVVYEPNGIPSQLDGVHSTPKSGPKAKPNGVLPNGLTYTPSRLLPVDASPASTAGKKRKKSLG